MFDDFRRTQRRGLRCPPRGVEHAAAGAHAAQRPGFPGGRPGAGPARWLASTGSIEERVATLFRPLPQPPSGSRRAGAARRSFTRSQKQRFELKELDARHDRRRRRRRRQRPRGLDRRWHGCSSTSTRLLPRAESMTQNPLEPTAVTRRHFFRDCGVGVGKIALAGLLDRRVRPRGHSAPPRDRPQSAGTPDAALRPEGEASDPPVHGRRAQPARSVRLQAGIDQARRQAAPALGDRRPALCVHPPRRGRAGPAVQVRAVRPERRRAFRDAAAPGQGGGRHLPHQVGPDRPVQPRACADLLQHGLLAARPAQPGLVGDLRPGRGEPRTCRRSW